MGASHRDGLPGVLDRGGAATLAQRNVGSSHRNNETQVGVVGLGGGDRVVAVLQGQI
jgi:hypothetical protein